MGVRFERAPRGGVNIYHSGGRGPQRSFVSAKEWAEICLEMEGGRVRRSNHATPSEVCDTCAREGREARERAEEGRANHAAREVQEIGIAQDAELEDDRVRRKLRVWMQDPRANDEFRNRAMGYLSGLSEVRGNSGNHGDEVDEDGVRAEWKMKGPWWRL